MVRALPLALLVAGGAASAQIWPGPHGAPRLGRPLTLPRAEQEEAYQARREGALRPLRDIENGVVPAMRRRGAEYIGSEYDGAAARYRLKFMRDGSVIWVDVDGRSGAVVARAGD